MSKELAKKIIKKMMRISGVNSQAELANFLGIKRQAISAAIARGSVPNAWFLLIEEKFGVDKDEIYRKALSIKHFNVQQGNRQAILTNSGNISIVDGKPIDMQAMVKIQDDVLDNLRQWMLEMEYERPGFSTWFKLEISNRFPEFEKWRQEKLSFLDDKDV